MSKEWIGTWFFGVPFWGVPLTLVLWVAYQLLRKRWLKAVIGTAAVAVAWVVALWLYFAYGVGCIESCQNRVTPPLELAITVVYGLFGYATILGLFLTWSTRA